MDKKLFFILSFLFLLCVSSFTVGATLSATAAFYLCGLALGLFAIFYAVGVLDYKVGGAQVTLEKRVETLEQTNRELQRAVTALFKSFYIFFDAAGRSGGPSEERKKHAFEHLKPISDLIAPDALAEVQSEISKLSKN